MNDIQTRRFVKSSYSGGNGGNCVEWAFTPNGVHVRDSKDHLGTELFFTFTDWEALTATVAAGTPHQSVTEHRHGIRLTSRDSALSFTHTEWNAFIAAARDGECGRTLEVAS